MAALLQSLSTAPAFRELPGLEERLRRVCSAEKGLSAPDLEGLRAAFNRFRLPYSQEVHRDGLSDLLRYLGHVMTPQEEVFRIAMKVTPYTEIDFEELITFVEQYGDFEQSKFRELFEAYDRDGSGTISVEECKKLTSDLGFLPLRGMIQETLDFVDVDKSGDLDFKEFMCFLTIYRHSEGFTRSQVAELGRVFGRFNGGDGKLESLLPISKLCDALSHMFGLHVRDLALALQNGVESSAKREDDANSPKSPSNAGVTQDVCFPEFVQYARRLREAEFELCRAEFVKYDKDNSGTISSEELRNALAGLGHHPSEAVLSEMLAQVASRNPSGECNLDLEEFFNFLLLFLERDGFTMKELRELGEIFDNADCDGSGEISVLELSDVLPELGRGSLDLDQVHLLVAHIDVNASGSLDFREFVRFMRLRREADFDRAREAFECCKDFATGLLFSEGYTKALALLGLPAPMQLPDIVQHGLSFEKFLLFAGEARKAYIEQQRRRAGFTETEVAEMRTLFDEYDLDNSGDIDGRELEPLLEDLGMAPTTRAMQRKVLERIEAARERARAAGVEEAELGKKPGAVTFPELLQLLRMSRDEHDRDEEARVLLAAQESRFSLQEVEQFREAYVNFRTRDSIFVPEKGAENTIVEGMDDSSTRTLVKTLGIASDDVRRLLRSLGVHMSVAQRERLDRKIDSLDASGRRELDFAGFLRLVRWLLDSDFAGINGLTAALCGGEVPDKVTGTEDSDEEGMSTRAPSPESSFSGELTAPQKSPSRQVRPSSPIIDTHDAAETYVLESAFHAYCKSPKGLDSRCFVKVCRDCGILDGQLTPVDAELIFTQTLQRSYMPAGHRFLDLSQFEVALRYAAARRGAEFSAALAKLAASDTLRRAQARPDVAGAGAVAREPAAALRVLRGAAASKKSSARLVGTLSSWIDKVQEKVGEDEDIPFTMSGSPARALLRSRSLPRVAQVKEQDREREKLPRISGAGSADAKNNRLEDLHGLFSLTEKGMTVQDFERLCKHCLLINKKFSDEDAATAFKAASKGRRHLGPEDLGTALAMVAAKKRVSEDAVLRTVSLCATPLSATAPSSFERSLDVRKVKTDTCVRPRRVSIA